MRIREGGERGKEATEREKEWLRERAGERERTSEGEGGRRVEGRNEERGGERGIGGEDKVSIAPMEVQTQLLYRVLCVYGLEVWVSEGHSGRGQHLYNTQGRSKGRQGEEEEE